MFINTVAAVYFFFSSNWTYFALLLQFNNLMQTLHIYTSKMVWWSNTSCSEKDFLCNKVKSNFKIGNFIHYYYFNTWLHQFRTMGVASKNYKIMIIFHELFKPKSFLNKASNSRLTRKTDHDWKSCLGNECATDEVRQKKLDFKQNSQRTNGYFCSFTNNHCSTMYLLLLLSFYLAQCPKC